MSTVQNLTKQSKSYIFKCCLPKVLHVPPLIDSLNVPFEWEDNLFGGQGATIFEKAWCTQQRDTNDFVAIFT